MTDQLNLNNRPWDDITPAMGRVETKMAKNKSKKKKHKKNIYTWLALGFLGVTVVIAAIIIALSISFADIRITPVVNEIKVDAIASVSAEGGGDDIIGRITEKEAQGARVFDTSATATKPVVATGVATIINETNVSQPLIVTTRLLTAEGVLYRIDKSITVPAKGSIVVGIYADEEGKASEIGPSKFTIPGLNEAKQKVIYAETKEAISNGTTPVQAVTQEGVQQSEIELAKELAQEVIDEMESSLSKDEHLITKTDVISKEINASLGDQIDSFQMDLTVRVTAVVIGDADVAKLTEDKLSSSITEDQMVIGLGDDDVKISLTVYDDNTKTAEIRLQAAAKSVIRDDSPRLKKELLTGKSADEVKKILESNDDIEKVDVNFVPFWVTKVPALEDHIRIKVLR